VQESAKNLSGFGLYVTVISDRRWHESSANSAEITVGDRQVSEVGVKLGVT